MSSHLYVEKILLARIYGLTNLNLNSKIAPLEMVSVIKSLNPHHH